MFGKHIIENVSISKLLLHDFYDFFFFNFLILVFSEFW